jgi:hypothetical protein
MARVRTDVSKELSTSFIRVTKIGELGTTLAVTSNRRTLRRNTPVLTIATRRNIPEEAIPNSHRRENFKSYTDDTSVLPQFRTLCSEPASLDKEIITCDYELQTCDAVEFCHILADPNVSNL